MKLLINFLKFACLFLICLIAFLLWLNYAPSIGTFSPIQKTLLFSLLLIGTLFIHELYTGGLSGIKELFTRKAASAIWAWRILGLTLAILGCFLAVGGIAGGMNIHPLVGKFTLAAGCLILATKGTQSKMRPN